MLEKTPQDFAGYGNYLFEPCESQLRGHSVPGNARPSVDWQATLSRHERWLRTVVYSRLRCREAVDEVMQEVALSVVAQRSPLIDTAKLAPWLYRLAIRQVLLYRRRCGRYRKLKNQYTERGSPEAQPPEADPLDWLLADERRALVRNALEKMSERDTEILLLKYTEDWSYHQIAGHLGVSHSAVESRLHRARQKLRSALITVKLVETP